MAAITIGKYKRPGIFFEEIDQSIIPPPPAPAPLASSLVVGFSKKGPINTPILISNLDDLEKIYGSLDRTMERKGSYFHRTIAKILETSPVLAMNLLPTSDTLDLIEYQSLSTATSKLNSDVTNIPFRYIHDTSSFWKRDNETFIDNIKNETNGADRLFHITNISSRPTTLFIFKSQLTGFNQSLIEYYGTSERVPPYVSPLDWASDYMVDVLAVGGDWTNYKELAVDVRWSAYFTEEGLKKNAIVDFATNRNVNKLALYQGCSLIPFFRDADGRNVFIETVINNDTDRTGLFCAFNADKVETGVRGEMIDIIGNNLVRTGLIVDSEQDELKFLSYSSRITEANRFPITPLDRADGVQAVMAVGPSISAFGGAAITMTYSRNFDTENWYQMSRMIGSQSGARTTYFSNEMARGFIIDAPNSATYSKVTTGGGLSSSVVFSFDIASQLAGTVSLGPWTNSAAYVVVDGQRRFITHNVGPTNSNYGASFSILRSAFVAEGTAQTYYNAVYVDNTGSLKLSDSNKGSLPVLSYDDCVLAFMFYTIQPTSPVGFAGSITASGIVPVASNISTSALRGFTASFNDISITTDYTVSVNGDGDGFTLTMLDTAVPAINGGGTNVTFQQNRYRAFRKIRWFNYLLSILDSSDKSKAVMITNVNTMEKISCKDFTVRNIVTDDSANKSFELVMGSAPTFDILAGNLIFYKVDDEYYPGNLGASEQSIRGATSFGVIGKFAKIVTDYKDGKINNGDYFYENFVGLTFSTTGNTARLPIRTVFTQTLDGKPAVVFHSSATQSPGYANPWPGIGGTESFLVGNSVKNFKTFTLVATTSNVNDPLTGTYFNFDFNREASAYTLDKPTVLEDIPSGTEIFNTYNRFYLRAWTDTNGLFNVRHSGESLTGTKEGFLATRSYPPVVISDLSNLKQTLEIYEPSGVIINDNIVLVDATKYKTVKVGDFLQAKVNTAMLETGEIGRRLTRILVKKPWSVDSNYTEITCDSAVQKFGVEGVSQTIAYTTIDQYVNTYQGLKLKGFKVRDEVLPDGSEEKQQAILNIVAKGTPLFKALTNKDAIDFRYIVDSFGLGLIADSKQQLVDLAGERLDCFAFINMPSIRQFKNSTNPSFTNPDGTLNTAYIAAGGDVDKGPSFLYSFGKGKGVSSAGYFLPYLVADDNGRPTELPPAMFVANTYLRKITGGNPSIVPWTIAAGVTNGRIFNISGVETNFSFEDIENLNLAQMNPIVFKRNRGFAIETENTAQTIFKSALSYIHVREVLIELERELNTMLLDFQWRFNTAEVRAEIKFRADGICERFVNTNGLFNYFNKCDEENNTPDLIDRQIGVIDTYVEPIKGMGVIVNNITILRTGAIEAGGFA